LPPLNILHVIGSTAPRYGGPSLAVRAMAAGVASRGAKVTVAATNADGPGRLDVPLDRAVIENGVEYRHFEPSLPGEWKFSWSLTRWLFAHAARFDVLHVHAAFSYSTMAGCRAAWHAGVPYVLRPLGTLDPWSLGHRSWKKRPYYGLIERAHLERASAIHVTSESEAAAITRLGFGRLTHVIPLGVDIPAGVGAPRATHDGPVRLLFLSRLHPKKELPVIFRAVRRLVDDGAAVRLTVAGTGDAPYEAELRAQVASLGLGAHVDFVGHIEGEAKWAAFADADIYLLPSRQENFGIAVAEAMAAGLPVIVSDQVAISTDVLEADAGEVVAIDPEALANAIARLAGDDVRRARLGANAAKLARDRYSWSHTTDQLMSLYHMVIAEHRAPAARREHA
jgi:glycosyltransferase involved in cell wall biosynthesis